MHPETSRTAHDADRGTVVVEAALVIPVLLIVTVLLVWVASLGASYVRLLDVDQTAARQAARGVPSVDAPAGVDVVLDEIDGLVRVEARERVAPPLIGFTGWDVVLRAEAHAIPESLFVESGADPW